MSDTHRVNAHAVLLPAFADAQLSNAVKQFLANGGCSILIGETREEYVSRQMTSDRIQNETPDSIIALTDEARSLSGNLLAAVDHEIYGICRLHDLVPSFPSKEEFEQLSIDQIATVSAEIARAAKGLGINCFLGPILDIVTGDNPWLKRRTWSQDPVSIAHVSSAFIRALQANGIAATAKHFPGYQSIELDPALHSEARNIESIQSFEISFIPFTEAINSGVELIMTGPAIVEAFDADAAASISPLVIKVLRERLGFRGVIMSDDLDAKAILRDRSIMQAAVDALRAGCDCLLIGDIDDHISKVVSAIVQAVESGDLSESRLNNAASKIRTLAEKYSQC